MKIRVDVVAGMLDAEAARRDVEGPAHGAVLVFWGNVRDLHEGRAVESVDYTAYEPMARRELEAVARECASAHGVGAVTVLHRIGMLGVGETSLIVAVGSAHRAEAFACGLAIIDALKRRVPVWKREIGPEGARWQDGRLPRSS
jgi:molybdopterin synthase catalytic subunit